MPGEEDLDSPVPIIPIGPGAAGVVGEPVTNLSREPEGGSPERESLDPAEDEDESPERDEHHGGISDAIRGLLGRDKFR